MIKVNWEKTSVTSDVIGPEGMVEHMVQILYSNRFILFLPF